MILLPVERKTIKARFILGLIYLFLTLGAATMVWPFLMMVTGSMTNRYDYRRYSPALQSLWNAEDRFMRVLAMFHPTFPREMYPNAPAHWVSWTVVAKDKAGIKAFVRPWLEGLTTAECATTWERMAHDYATFNATYDIRNSVCTYDERDIAPFVQQTFEAQTGFQGREVALKKLNETWALRYNSFYGIRMRAQARVPLHYPDWDWQDDPKTELWHAFKAHLRGQGGMPYSRTRPYCIAPLWQKWCKALRITPSLFPGDADDPFWQNFVRTAYPKRLMRIKKTPEIEAQWHLWLKQQCKTPEAYLKLTEDAARVSKNHAEVLSKSRSDFGKSRSGLSQTPLAFSENPADVSEAAFRFEDIPLPEYENSTLWRGFLATLPLEAIELTSPESAWQDYLRQTYGSLEALNCAYGLQVDDWRAVPLPQAEAFAITYRDFGRQLLWHDITANYRTVCDILFLRGSAFTNTIILVVLTILATLLVNPLAAYALSRFNLRWTEGILLFLLATMAFPAAVTAIPGFMLIRELGLLNTFAALVLPTVANGLSIFILKGFFDGLPRELYEAAAIDGASEWQIFRHITLPMTTPILAVNALNAFVAAYNSWEWALLVCQRQSHWTLSVWMYQLSQQFSGTPWVVMAGFVIISLPTALVFLLCQRVILRGIVLPSMK